MSVTQRLESREELSSTKEKLYIHVSAYLPMVLEKESKALKYALLNLLVA